MNFERDASVAPFPGRCPPRRNGSRHRWQPIGALMALLSIAGCVGYTPAPLDPLDALDGLAHRGLEGVPLEVESHGRTVWIPLEAHVDVDDGIDIAEANALALFYSPRLLATRRAERASGAQLLGAGLLSNPELFVGPRISTRSGDAIVPASLAWELPLWGKARAEREQAQRELSVMSARVLDAELSVLREVREAFIRMSSLREQIALLETRSAGCERVFAWISRLEEAGEVDAVSVYLARLEISETRAELEATRLQHDSARRGLLARLGLPPSDELTVSDEPSALSLPSLPPTSRESLLAQPAAQVPLREYDAAEAALALEVKRQYPAVRVGPELEDDAGDTSIGIGIGIELPLFDRNQGGIALAGERRADARERLESTLLSLMHEDASARAELESAERVLEEFRSGALTTVADATAALEARLGSGESSALEALAALRALTGARLRETELVRDAAIARLRAAFASGAVFAPASHAQTSGGPHPDAEDR